MVTVPSASDLAHDCPGWGSWSDAPILFLRRRPLTTLGRPTPTAVADSQWGEPRSEVFATDARVAGSSVTVAGSCCPEWTTVSIRRLRGGQSRLVMSGERNVGQGRSKATASCGSHAKSRYSVTCKCFFTDPCSHRASEGNEIARGSTALRCANYHSLVYCLGLPSQLS